MRFESSRGHVVKVTCAVDEVDCTEYKLGSEYRSNSESIQECFISAEINQTIRLDICSPTFVCPYQADLVIDGVIRDTAVFRRVRYGKYGRKCHSFEHGMWKEGRSTCRRQLKIVELPPRTSGMTDDEDSDDFWGDRDDAIVGTIEVRIFMETSNTGPEDKVLDNYDTYRRAKDVFYGVQDIKPTHSIEGGTAIEITQRKKSTIRSNINRPRLSTRPLCVFRFSYRSRNSLQLAGVISASPTPKTHASIESSGDEQSQTAGEELTTGKDGDTTSLIAITSSEVWIMTNKTSTTEKSQPLDVLNSALHVDTGNLTPMPEMPEMANTLKRSLELSPLLGQKAESPSLRDDIKHVLKHRKNEIKALKAELEALTQKKADSARRVEEARRRREEQERILNEEYEALEREKLDVLQSIAADQEAEEEHLRGLEDDSE